MAHHWLNRTIAAGLMAMALSLAAGLAACGPADASSSSSSTGQKSTSTPTPTATPTPAPAPTPATGGKGAEHDKPGFITMSIGGTPHTLEYALTPARRFRGLSERGVIPVGTGMLFVFPDNQVGPQAFVMRDCPAPIDIIYLDPRGRIVAMYTMQPEPPRSEAEKVLTPPFEGAPQWACHNADYEARLKQYPSRFPTQFVIEIPGGAMATLPKPLRIGDQLPADWDAIRKMAK
jgi:uncharacterized membrane protein (UPF0127 family)